MQEVAPVPAVQGPEKVTASLSTDQKRALVQRVASSKAFSRAPALRAFLLYITDHSFSGQAEKLKEQAIGAEVLGRKPNYDPADDNIVRVRAHELRERLGRYFATEGSQEPFVVTIPRGRYAPEFLPREVAASEQPVAAKTAEITPQATKDPRQARWHWAVIAAILLVAVPASIVLTRLAFKTQSHGTAIGPRAAVTDFWGQFFDKPNEELKIVYADSSFALWQDLAGKSLNLGDYINHTYLRIPGDTHLDVATRKVTSMADISVATHLANVVGQFGGQVNLQYARDTNADFLHHGNLVLIGSHRSNPWVELYEPNLNFVLGQDPHTGAPMFMNRSTRRGEAQEYAIPEMFDVQQTEEIEFPSYGVVALLKGCGDRGLTVILEGLNMQATQAVGEVVSDPQRLNTLLQSIGHKPGTNVAPFEALIQITSLPNGYDAPKVIAYRIRSADSCVGN